MTARDHPTAYEIGVQVSGWRWTARTVYVADSGHNRVLKLAAGSTTPTTLPFTG